MVKLCKPSFPVQMSPSTWKICYWTQLPSTSINFSFSGIFPVSSTLYVPAGDIKVGALEKSSASITEILNAEVRDRWTVAGGKVETLQDAQTAQLADKQRLKWFSRCLEDHGRWKIFLSCLIQKFLEISDISEISHVAWHFLIGHMMMKQWTLGYPIFGTVPDGLWNVWDLFILGSQSCSVFHSY